MANSITLYPVLTDEMKEQASIHVKPYSLSYKRDGVYLPLSQKGKGKIMVEDKDQIWKAETHGLRIRATVTIERPEYLRGVNGVVCEGAEYGLCLVWTNKALSQMGYIQPRMRESDICEVYDFDHLFKAGEIKDNLSLELIVYVETAADSVKRGEEGLMNEEGVVVGDLGVAELVFTDDSMTFPVMEVEIGERPLWWLEVSDWDDPLTDPFDTSHVCLYLNKAHPYYQSSGLSTYSGGMLTEIITTAYFTLFQEAEARGCLPNILSNTKPEPGSIAAVLFYFAKNCDPNFRTESASAMHDSIHVNVERLLRGEE